MLVIISFVPNNINGFNRYSEWRQIATLETTWVVDSNNSDVVPLKPYGVLTIFMWSWLRTRMFRVILPLDESYFAWKEHTVSTSQSTLQSDCNRTDLLGKEVSM